MSNRLKVVDQKLAQIPHEKEGLRLWLRFVECSQLVEQEIRSVLREKFDTTLPRFELMAALSRVPDGLTMGELSHWLMVTKGNVTGIAERLSEDGFIKRRPTPTDRRSFCVTLTPKGHAVIKQMEREYETLLEHIFAELTVEDIDMFLGVLAKAKESVTELHDQRDRA